MLSLTSMIKSISPGPGFGFTGWVVFGGNVDAASGKNKLLREHLAKSLIVMHSANVDREYVLLYVLREPVHDLA